MGRPLELGGQVLCASSLGPGGPCSPGPELAGSATGWAKGRPPQLLGTQNRPPGGLAGGGDPDTASCRRPD